MDKTKGVDDLTQRLSQLLVGQPEAITKVTPFIRMHNAGLSPANRPIGVVLMLGPTGAGKSHTVEALARVLHESSSPRQHVLRIDCAEFQSPHEVAKLIGAPPGYLGHRETIAALSQARVNSVASNSSDISLVLFDEIEKADPALTRMLLGILDNASLRLGDNSTVNFERCLVFMTSNLGAREIQRAITPEFGFELMVQSNQSPDYSKLKDIGIKAVKRKFAPEFVNRIDAVITYNPLTRDSCRSILDLILNAGQQLVIDRLGLRGFNINVTREAKELLLDEGVSVEFGARELKRTVQRRLMQPVADMVSVGKIPPASTVVLGVDADGFTLTLAKSA